MIEERAAAMCSERMRSTVAKKAGPSFSVGGCIEDIVRVEDIIRDEDSPPFGMTERDGEREPCGECNGEVQSWLQGVLLVPRAPCPVPTAGL